MVMVFKKITGEEIITAIYAIDREVNPNNHTYRMIAKSVSAEARRTNRQFEEKK